jgi:hypothetical protein
LGLATLNTLDLKGNRIEQAKRLVKKEEAEKDFKEFSSPQLISGKNGRIQNMWISLEKLLYDMSKQDSKLSMKDFWAMNTYEFYRYKQLMLADLKSKRKK